jgi:hypothetical protein
MSGVRQEHSDMREGLSEKSGACDQAPVDCAFRRGY